MAKSIIISERKAVSLSTFAFWPIIDKTRERFSPEERAFMVEIYRPYDDEGQQFIALDEQGEEGFNAFYRATLAAYEDETRVGTPIPKADWEELLEKLRADPRWHSSDVKAR